MNLDVDNLINFFEKYSSVGSKEEVGEQDTGGGGAGGGTGGSTTKGNTPSKWAEVVGGPKRGVANNPTQAAQIWAKDVGGPVRGVANKLGTA